MAFRIDAVRAAKKFPGLKGMDLAKVVTTKRTYQWNEGSLWQPEDRPVQGTGLLFSCELAPQFKGYGVGSTEEWLREHGMGVIHGGANSLRFTPHFAITSEEVDLIVDHVRQALLKGPRSARAEAA